MASLDSRSIHVHTAAHDRGDDDFHTLMAEQLRRAPWLLLSLALHGAAFLLLWLMPTTRQVREDLVARVVPPEQVVDLPVEQPPEELPIVDPTPLDPELQDFVITDPSPIDDSPLELQELSASSDPTSSPDQWNAAVGLGGGGRGGSKYGMRAGHGHWDRGVRAVSPTIEDALRWLKAHQDEDGRWDADEFMKHDVEGEPCDGPGNPVHDIGITSLALLAFLGDGSTLRQGRYAGVVKKAVGWLKDQQDLDTGLFGTNNSNDFIYDHAIATLAMVEAYGLSDYRLLKKHAQGGINYLERHRNPYMVWRYQPRDSDDDTSITGWAVMAYKAAQDFKLDVNEQALSLAETWFDQMTDPVSGRTGYIERGGSSSRRPGDHAVRFPRDQGECMTAVSLLCRFFLGHDPAEDEMMAIQADLILKKPPVWNEEDGSIDHYYWYYATYALYQFGGRAWKDWERHLTGAVVKQQRKDGNYDGSWDAVGVWGEDGGRVYSTALLALTLEAYYRYTRLIR